MLFPLYLYNLFEINKYFMTKKTIALLTILAIFSFKIADQKEHNYTVTIPEHLIQPFYSLINGGSIDNLTVGQMKELTQIINSQVQPQYAKYREEDSIELSKHNPKPIQQDSTHNKK
jgi:hypothetical protein